MDGSESAHDERMWLLLVDDDRALRDMIIGALDPICFHAELAEGVPAAEILAGRHRFDMVVCGRPTTLAALNDCLKHRRIPGLVFATEAAITTDDARVQVVRRPATIAACRDALLEAMARRA